MKKLFAAAIVACGLAFGAIAHAQQTEPPKAEARVVHVTEACHKAIVAYKEAGTIEVFSSLYTLLDFPRYDWEHARTYNKVQRTLAQAKATQVHLDALNNAQCPAKAVADLAGFDILPSARHPSYPYPLSKDEGENVCNRLVEFRLVGIGLFGNALKMLSAEQVDTALKFQEGYYRLFGCDKLE
ncbi:MAG: hypothetical protein WAX89_01625 [Alphaproteobacteria bacterium]